jgi:hypothetical protein
MELVRALPGRGVIGVCTYLTLTTDMAGSALGGAGWFGLGRAVVYFDHPQDVALGHALCIDFRAADGDPASRIAVELDGASARRLAQTILAVLDSPEVRELEPSASP